MAVLTYIFSDDEGRPRDSPLAALQSAQGSRCTIALGQNARYSWDAERPLRRFTCDSALMAAELWIMPAPVERYLKTQDEKLRAEAFQLADEAVKAAHAARLVDRSSLALAQLLAARASWFAASGEASWVVARRADQAITLALTRARLFKRTTLATRQINNLTWLLMRSAIHDAGFKPHGDLNSRLAWLRSYQDNPALIRCGLVVWRTLDLPELAIAETYAHTAPY